MSNLPPFEDALTSTAAEEGALAKALAILFEASPTLYQILVPELASRSAEAKAVIKSYPDLIDASLEIIFSWDDDLKARFVGGHPRIGEVKGLSHLSAKEQAAVGTTPEILARLAHLNTCYEHRYPGLIYITFVNGRTRAQIRDEMESVLGLDASLSPDQPPVEFIGVVNVGSRAWLDELNRALADVGRIAKSRLKSLEVASYIAYL